MSELHVPRIRIVTPVPVEGKVPPPAALSRVEVDGQLWPILGYSISVGSVNDIQTITLTFHGDVTIEHAELESR